MFLFYIILFLFYDFIVFPEDSSDHFSLLWKISNTKYRIEKLPLFPLSHDLACLVSPFPRLS